MGLLNGILLPPKKDNNQNKPKKETVKNEKKPLKSLLLPFKKHEKKSSKEQVQQRKEKNEALQKQIDEIKEQVQNAPTAKERRKLQKQVEKLQRKLETGFDGEAGFTAPFGYLDEDGYLLTGKNRAMSVFDLMFQYGTNNPASIGWVTDIIPRSPIRHGEIHFIQRQRGMEKAMEEDVFTKHLKSNSETISNEETADSRVESQNKQRVNDMALAKYLAGQEETIVDSDMLLLVKGKKPEDIEIAVEELKDSYKDSQTKGVMTIRKTGQQLETLRDMLDRPHTDARHNSDMVSVASARLFLPSSGFSDPDGEDIGIDVNSILPQQHATANFAGVKNAVIFSGGVSAGVTFSDGRLPAEPMEFGGSTIATMLSKASYLAGRRTHHILINRFDYKLPNDSLYFDMRKDAINPFEVFGHPETVKLDFEANLEKAVNMMMLLSNDLNNDDKYIRTNLHNLLLEWYLNEANGGGIYTENPDDNPMRAQMVLAKEEHEDYPTPTDFLTAVGNYNQEKRANDGELERRDAEHLYKTLKDSFSQHPEVFARTTSIPDQFGRNDRNIYYDISRFSTKKEVKGAVFLNVLSYVANRALEGEIIVIHGLDGIKITEDMLLAYNDILKRRGIGKIVVFEDKANDEINPETFSRFTGSMNTQDLVVVGGLTDRSVKNVSWFASLPMTVQQQLAQQQQGLFFFYRKADRVSSVVQTSIQLTQ